MPAALEALGQCADHSWIERLTPDPETDTHAPNKQPRQVRSGHYVRVLPTPLPKPRLVIHSPPTARALGLTEEECKSEAFCAFFSGEQGRIRALQSWCTPYALAIMGQALYSNCPFGNGNGYGDGRAVSVGEVVVGGQRWEMQLKGGGRTPFCRGADGRAVLRSSVREFLASEAMHNLGVETTRALSLIVSGAETVQRPWYSGATDGPYVGDPDTLISEACAITTRVAPSFLRVGHVDLFARRVRSTGGGEEAKRQHEQIVEHLLFREYPDVAPGEPLPSRAAAMLDAAAERIGTMAAGWLRVGFCQGNFNADNCLAGGRTMDYGPFGWIEKYDPLFAKWVGSGEHFAFMNQPKAAGVNYLTLVHAVAPVFGDNWQERGAEFQKRGFGRIQALAEDVWRAKLGLPESAAEVAAELWGDLEPLLEASDIDYTLFWRQLAVVAEMGQASDESLLGPLQPALYKPLRDAVAAKWLPWLRRWLAALEGAEGGLEAAPQRLRAVNPKYIPREWMLIDAYDRAKRGDYSIVHELYNLFLDPYGEQPAFEAKYYRRAPDETLTKGGCAKMS